MHPMPGFEPGPTTKNLLWYVNASRRLLIGAVSLPGLIKDDSQISTVFFVISVFLELIGLQFIIAEIDLGFWKGLMGVSFLLLLDILFAFLFHIRIKTITRCESEQAILSLNCRFHCAENVNQVIDPIDGGFSQEYVDCLNMRQAVETDRINSETSRAALTGYIFMMLIWLVAAFKMFSFWSLQSVTAAGIDTKAVFIIVTYVIVAIIHTYFTGYAIFSIFARYSWWRDEKAFVQNNSLHRAIVRSIQFITDVAIPNRVAVNNHTLERLLYINLMVRDGNGNGQVMIATGSFFDQRFTAYIEQNFPKDPDKRAVMLTVSIPTGVNRGNLDNDFISYLSADWGITKSDIDLLSCGKYLNRLTTTGLLFDDELERLGGLIPGVAGGPIANEFAIHGRKHQLEIMH